MPGPHRQVSGRQIRWGTVGRVAAVVAAAIAGIASLPALLGGDAPPPVPPDVGLAPAPVASTPVPEAQPLAPPPPKRRRRHQRATAPRMARRTHGDHHRHHHREVASGETVPLPAPAYAPSYAPPPRPGEFQFER